MTEKEILEKIKLSAEEIKAPEGISPETVKMRLEAEKKRHRKKTGNYKKTMVAAAVLLVCGISVAGRRTREICMWLRTTTRRFTGCWIKILTRRKKRSWKERWRAVG